LVLIMRWPRVEGVQYGGQLTGLTAYL